MGTHLEAESEIRKLLARYCHACDDRREQDFGALFTDDAVYEVTGERYGQVRTGRAEIIEHIGTWRANYTPDRHVLANELIEVDDSGSTARVAVDFVHLWEAEEGHTVGGVGRYYMRLQRGDAGWLVNWQAVVFRGDPAPDGV